MRYGISLEILRVEILSILSSLEILSFICSKRGKGFFKSHETNIMVVRSFRKQYFESRLF